MSFLREFKAFANRGNVLDLAVAVVIGGAFAKIIAALVADVIMPIVGALMPSNEWRTWTVTPLQLKLGDFLGAVVDFLLIALVLFIVVHKLLAKLRPAAAPETKKCGECLEEIALQARRCRACGQAVAVALFLFLVLFSGPARAGDPKFEYKDAPEKPPEKATVYKANASLGLVWAAGNSQSLGFSGNGLFSVKHYNNQVEAFAQAAYVVSGISKYGAGGPITDHNTSTQFWLARARYDRFFYERNTVFAAFQVSGDRPAGYWYRLEPQVGYSRLVLKTAHQLMRTEAGYDYTFEHRAGAVAPRNVEYHSLRLYGYYENKLTRYASFTEGCELLWALNDIESVRVTSLTSLSSTISKNVSLKLNFTVKFNNAPPPRPGNLVDPATLMTFVPAPSDATLDKVDTILEAVVAVTIL